MKRWLLWFAIGFVLVVLNLWSTAGGPRTSREPLLILMLPLVLWFYVTVFAVPIGLILWLVRGRHRSSPD